MWVSYRHQHTDLPATLSFEDKIDVFYAQTFGWQLHIADLIANSGATLEAPGGRPSYHVDAIEHSGFAVLHICLSYLELVGSMIETHGSKKRFKAGARHVFPNHFHGSSFDEPFLERLYDGARCGLYHAARTRQRVGLGEPHDGTALMYIPEDDRVIISPSRLPTALITHLSQFKLELLDTKNTQIRDEFVRQFDRGFEQHPSAVKKAAKVPKARRHP
jgi:hypothetical protein